MTQPSQKTVLFTSFAGKDMLLPPTDFSHAFGLLHVAQGQANVMLSGQEVMMKQGDVLLIPQNVVIFAKSEEHTSLKLLCSPVALVKNMMQTVEKDLFDMLLLQARMRPYLLTENTSAYDDILSALRLAEDESQSKEPGYLLMMHAQTGSLAASLLRRYSIDKNDSDRMLCHNLSRMTGALTYMEANLGKKLTLANISQQMGLSADYFSHLVQNSTGKTAMQYLQVLRVNSAMHQLLTTTASLGDIAKSVGYANAHSLSAVFSHLVGMTPTAFRRLLPSEK